MPSLVPPILTQHFMTTLDMQGINCWPGRADEDIKSSPIANLLTRDFRLFSPQFPSAY